MANGLNKFSVLIAISVTLIAILFLYTKSSKENYFVYALDDPYIHLDIAQNFVEHNTYGVHKDEFSSPSSSPIWTLLLAATIKLTQNNDKIPFILNLVLIPFVIFLLNRLLLSYNINRYRWVFLISTSLMISLPTLVISGMEHVLHICLILSLFLSFKKDFSNNSISIISIILLLTLPLVRYESLFFTFILSLIFLRKKNYKQAILFLILPLIPVIAFGLFSIQNGYHFFPNSLLLKGSSGLESIQGIFLFVYKGLRRIVEDFSMLGLFNLLVLSFMFFSALKLPKLDLLICLSLLLIHSLFAQFGWLYRYEAYILALSIPIIIGSAKSILESTSKFKKHILILFLIVSLPIFIRSTEAYKSTLKSIRSIEAQHFSFAKLIKDNFDGDVVAMNDIGVTGYYNNENYILDLYGLANIEVADAKQANKYNSQFIEELFSKYNPKLIIVYRSWFAGNFTFPENYKLAYQWEILINTGVGDFLIDFYVPEENVDSFTELMNDFKLTSNDIYKRKINANR